MESDSSSAMKIEKLSESNFYSWRQKIQHILALKDLDDLIDDDPSARPSVETSSIENINAWTRRDKKAKAIIGLSLSDDLLNHVREVKTAKDMWEVIQNVFERHTLLNKLSARRRFYTAVMEEEESVLQFSNRITQLASILCGMGVEIDDSEKAMALLNGLPEQFDTLISALDAIQTEDFFSFTFVKSKALQEEDRLGIRMSSSAAKNQTAALFSSSTSRGGPGRPKCTHCHRLGHLERTCWKKYPHLSPHRNSGKSTASTPGTQSLPQSALIANSTLDPTEDSSAFVCLMTKSSSKDPDQKSSKWFIDSGCSHHMTHDRSAFCSYSNESRADVELGNQETSKVVGAGSVLIPLQVNGETHVRSIQDVLHVSDLGYQLLSVATLDANGLQIEFSHGSCRVLEKGRTFATGSLKGNLYELDVSSAKTTSLQASSLLVNLRI